MIDFFIISGPDANRRLEDLIAEGGVNLAQMDGKKQFAIYRSSANNAVLGVIYDQVAPFAFPRQFLNLDSNGAELFFGHAYIADGIVTSIDQIKGLDKEEINGNWIRVFLSKNGDMRLVRSNVSVIEVYYSSRDGHHFIGSRASLVACAAQLNYKPTIDANFIRWVGTYGVCGNNCSLFTAVDTLMIGEVLSIKASNIRVEKTLNPLVYSNDLRERYLRFPTEYWDETYEILIESLQLVNYTDDPIQFPLSGGKDSRLLLALLLKGGFRERIKWVFTNGPRVSPEVRSAALVCEELNFPHQIREQSAVLPTNNVIDLWEKLLVHLFVSEGEMSPVDLVPTRNRKAVTEINGQEGGLRNIAGDRSFSSRSELVSWFLVHLGNCNKAGILEKEAQDKNREDLESFITFTQKYDIPWSDVPSVHRVAYRASRWVSRTWKILNTSHFVPYLFMNSEVIARTLSAGAESRIREEFHFEMLRRIAPELLCVPFANQSWHPLIINGALNGNMPDALLWPEEIPPAQQRPTFVALMDNWQKLIDYTCDVSALHDVVSFDILREIDPIKLHVANYHILWQIFQSGLAANILDWRGLGKNEFVKTASFFVEI